MFVSKFAYIKSRIFSFFNRDLGTHNFQSDKALDSIVSGGFFGKGIGEGTLKNRVPEAHTDYIISVISEEFGVISIILILFIFLGFIYLVFKKINPGNVSPLAVLAVTAATNTIITVEESCVSPSRLREYTRQKQLNHHQQEEEGMCLLHFVRRFPW